MFLVESKANNKCFFLLENSCQILVEVVIVYFLLTKTIQHSLDFLIVIS